MEQSIRRAFVSKVNMMSVRCDLFLRPVDLCPLVKEQPYKLRPAHYISAVYFRKLQVDKEAVRFCRLHALLEGSCKGIISLKEICWTLCESNFVS